MEDFDEQAIRSSVEFARGQRNVVVQELCDHLESCLLEIETLRKVASDEVKVTILKVGSGELVAIIPPLGTRTDELDTTLDTIRRFVSSKGVRDTLIVGLFGSAKIQHLDQGAMKKLGWVRSDEEKCLDE